MPFQPKPPKMYSKEKLQHLSRDELNTISLSMNHIPAEQTTNADLIMQIMEAQKTVMANYQAGRDEKAAAKQAVSENDAPEQKEQKTGHSLDRTIPGPEDTEPDQDERIWFKVAAGEGKLGKAPLFAALNGESILVQRGRWVKLKKKFLNVLQHAIVTEVEQDKDGEKTLRDVPRFNYQTRSLEEGQPVETDSQSRSSF